MRILLFMMLAAGAVSIAVGLFAPGRDLRWTVVPGLAAVLIAATQLTAFGTTTAGMAVTALAGLAAVVALAVGRPWRTIPRS